MSAILGSAVTGAGGGAYTIDNSVRLRSSASAYLNRTPSVTSNRRTFTWSAWVKIGVLSATSSQLVSFGDSGTNRFQIVFYNNNLEVSMNNGSWVIEVTSSAVYRDPSAWYHIVVAVDTTQATASNRVKVYVNGSQVTSFGTATYPSQNLDTPVNTTVTHKMGTYWNASSAFFDGYLTEINFIDGQQLTPSSFGETNASTGVWQPKAYTGTYGTNGFYLKFSDIATTSGSNAGLGKDFSGNGNYWTTNNISVTSGVTYDAMTDSPTPKSATVGNFCTMNPNLRQTGTSSAPTNGNLKITVNNTSGYGNGVGATMAASSGKWYWEITKGGTYGKTGIANTNGTEFTSVMCSASSTPSDFDAYSWGWALNVNTGNKINAGSSTAYGGSLASGDIIMCAVDVDAGKVWWGKNGTWFASGDPAAGTNAAFTNVTGNIMPIGVTSDTGSNTQEFNFGQRPFSYTPPTGFKRLNTYNLPTPTIGASSTTLANKYFNTVTYTGTGTTQSITGVGFQPDFVWVKGRNVASSHQLYDINRGVTKQLASDLTSAEFTTTGGLTAFGSDGFTGGGVAGFNGNGNTFASWNWKGSNTTASNTSGTITSTVSVNTTSGFSIVTYTGNGSAGATVGHGLNTTPKMVIIKNRNEAAGTDWQTWFTGFGTSGTITRAYLNKVNVDSSSTNYFYPTSTTIYMGSGDHFFNSGSYNYVAYCFAEVAGFSKFGSYTGNGSTDGPFVYTGFRPAYVLIKLISSPYNWWSIKDSVRDPYNTATHALNANLSDTEYNPVDNNDFLSNGFKIRNTGTINNTNGSTYIYMAFAENPFNYSLAR